MRAQRPSSLLVWIVAMAGLAALSLAPVSGCVSRNVEEISGEEATTDREGSGTGEPADREPAPPPPAATGGGPGPGSPPAGTEALATDEAPSGGRVAGRIEVAPELRDAVPADGMIYVIVRVAGRATGPPLAVKRLPGRLPAEFVVTGADAMVAGTPLSGDVMVEARFDQDGAATTRSRGDLSGRIDGVAVDADRELVVVLDEVVDDAGGGSGAGG